MNNTYKRLFKEHFINDKQFEFIDAIETKKKVSLYAELRLVLYIGISLFTGGLGYFMYQNLGNIGHLFAMLFISVSILYGFYFVQKHAKQYSNNEVLVEQPYFDYILVLIALLIVTLFTYVQVYFDLIELFLNWTSFIAAGIFFFMAYRYDNRALLSMGIVAVTAGIGISISPVNWSTGDWNSTIQLYLTSIVFGAILFAVGRFSHQREIKKHFKFTYQNFGLVLMYSGSVLAMFTESFWYAIFLLLTAGSIGYFSWLKKEFLFFLYSTIAVYLSFTFLLFKMLYEIEGETLLLLIYYIPITCVLYLILMFQNKSHFAYVE